ncbi:hypothetical protein A3F66_00250 [candidate division TM6 bacterium RIFCSPHIGHO2_12_FULL_32_22]|nr:MAG: hypothetical protein A3F66_00250 [candidate division TM6 bacterium RIFCSPHIGHO2_12_FULL_32_22]
MNLFELLDNLNLILDNNVIYFQGDSFLYLFFSIFKRKLKEKNIISVKSVDLSEMDFASFKTEINFTFLGNRVFYWLGNIDSYTTKIKTELIYFLEKYDGPNIISFFSSDRDISFDKIKFGLVESDKVSKLAQFVFDSKINSDKFLDKFGKLDIDQVIILLYYSKTLGARYKNFLSDWSDQVIETESSLFTLSSLYFSKQKSQFLEYWQKIKSSYSDTFWTVFWQDQLFRAYWFIYYKEQKDPKNLKKISYKLPFSFINGDYKKHSLKELQSTQNRLYITDCTLKQGFGDFQLDFLLIKH